MSMVAFWDELQWRGLVADYSPELPARLTGAPIAAYVGFDPSAASLHVGHLIPVMALAHLQRSGGHPFVVIGGATGMVGDPSGKSAERNLLSHEDVTRNAAALRAQLARLLQFDDGPNPATLLDNYTWIAAWNAVDFLDEVGHLFPLGAMLTRDAVTTRLARGLSLTEFAYPLLQAYDFLHLHDAYGVELQLGGADQWGNIAAGLDLIRRVGSALPAYGLGLNLLTGADGRKLGKTEQGAIYLDAARTSRGDFEHYWLTIDERDVERCLRFFTFLSADEIAAALAGGLDRARQLLAATVTHLVHD